MRKRLRLIPERLYGFLLGYDRVPHDVYIKKGERVQVGNVITGSVMASLYISKVTFVQRLTRRKRYKYHITFKFDDWVNFADHSSNYVAWFSKNPHGAELTMKAEIAQARQGIPETQRPIYKDIDWR